MSMMSMMSMMSTLTIALDRTEDNWSRTINCSQQPIKAELLKADAYKRYQMLSLLKSAWS